MEWNKKIQKYLETHIDTIEDMYYANNLSHLYNTIRKDLGVRDSAELVSLLRQIDINLPIQVAPVMFGAGRSSKILSLRATRDGGKTWNAGLTDSQGMKGGHLIGFMTIQEAEDFIKKFDPQCHIRQLQVSTVDGYDWQKISTPYGSCYATTYALKSFKLTTRTTHPWSLLESDIRKKKKKVDSINAMIGTKGITWEEYYKVRDAFNDYERRIDINSFVMKKFKNLVKDLNNQYWGRFYVHTTTEFNATIGAELYERRWDDLMANLNYTKENFDLSSPYSKSEIVESIRKYIEDALNSKLFPEIRVASVSVELQGSLFFDIGFNIQTTPSAQELFQQELDKVVSPETQLNNIELLEQERDTIEDEIVQLKQQVKELKRQATTTSDDEN